MDYEKYYNLLSAINSVDFNTCFYCGCEASEQDYIPPVSLIQEWISAQNKVDFISVPACDECVTLLKNQSSATLDERVDIVKMLLKTKYEKAIRVYQMWEKSELAEMDDSFTTSIDAGMRLGKEASQRYHFKGFDYEVDGQITRVGISESQVVTVFEKRFDNYKLALEYVCQTYRIPKSRVSELYFGNNQSFDEAINEYHRVVERMLFEKELKKQCLQFAKKHVQNFRFVERTVEKYMRDDPEMDIEGALKKLYYERVDNSINSRYF